MDINEKIEKLRTLTFVNRQICNLSINKICYVYNGKNKNENAHKSALLMFVNICELLFSEMDYSITYGYFNNIWCYKIKTKNG